MPQPKPSGPTPTGAPQQLPVELPDDVSEGIYSNLMFITHSPSEFVLDFARALPGARKGRVYSRIVMTPQHAKALSDLLQRNIATFEDKHGDIHLHGRPDEMKIGFTPSAPAPEAPKPPQT